MGRLSAGVELVVDARVDLAEGPAWNPSRGVLHWIDIHGGVLHTYDPATGTDKGVRVGERIGTVVVRRRGGLVLATASGFRLLDPESGDLVDLADPESDKPGNRFNDGKCDPSGRFWAGTMSLDERPGAGTLYRLDADHSVAKALDGVTISNGIVWSADARSMYYIDTPTRRVDVFDFAPETGEISRRRTAVRIPEGMGYPDGMAIDRDGMLWVALWGGSCVGRWNPGTGALLGTVPVPATQVTACAFGGPDAQDLYITTARQGLGDTELERQPHAGGVFRARVRPVGRFFHEYAG